MPLLHACINTQSPIQKHTLPGSIIYSDKWKEYNNISTLGYKHFAINHSEQFVDGNIHTQSIERMSSDMREWVIVLGPGSRRSFMNQYISRYFFVTSFPDKRTRFHHFMIAAVKLCPTTDQALTRKNRVIF